MVIRILFFKKNICERRNDTNYVLDHTYALPIATQPYIIDNESFSIYSDIEIDTEVDAVQNEVLFDYIPSDLVPLSHCRFIVDLDFMAEQLKHSILSANPSCDIVYYALGVRPLVFSGLMYIRNFNVLLWSCGKIQVEELELLTLIQKLQQAHFIHVVSE